MVDLAFFLSFAFLFNFHFIINVFIVLEPSSNVSVRSLIVRGFLFSSFPAGVSLSGFLIADQSSFASDSCLPRIYQAFHWPIYTTPQKSTNSDVARTIKSFCQSGHAPRHPYHILLSEAHIVKTFQETDGRLTKRPSFQPQGNIYNRA